MDQNHYRHIYFFMLFVLQAQPQPDQQQPQGTNDTSGATTEHSAPAILVIYFSDICMLFVLMYPIYDISWPIIIFFGPKSLLSRIFTFFSFLLTSMIFLGHIIYAYSLSAHLLFR